MSFGLDCLPRVQQEGHSSCTGELVKIVKIVNHIVVVHSAIQALSSASLQFSYILFITVMSNIVLVLT